MPLPVGRRCAALLAMSLAAVSVFSPVALAQPAPLSTSFTYQGELASAGTPASGSYDIRFRLYDAASGGTQIGSTLCSDNLAVANGRFAASLDFGAVFAGQKRFLELEVRQDTGLDCSDATGFATLTSRQKITAASNAIAATHARLLAEHRFRGRQQPLGDVKVLGGSQ